jgi:pentose-5-phosphate-3-epimerase
VSSKEDGMTERIRALIDEIMAKVEELARLRQVDGAITEDRARTVTAALRDILIAVFLP